MAGKRSIDDAYTHHVGWAQANGHSADTVAGLKAHEKAKGISRGEANGIADLQGIGGGDTNWRSQGHMDPPVSHEYADQRGHDVFNMTASEREGYGHRMSAVDNAVSSAGAGMAATPARGRTIDPAYTNHMDRQGKSPNQAWYSQSGPDAPALRGNKSGMGESYLPPDTHSEPMGPAGTPATRGSTSRHLNSEVTDHRGRML
jgi:hypothetical protein